MTRCSEFGLQAFSPRAPAGCYWRVGLALWLALALPCPSHAAPAAAGRKADNPPPRLSVDDSPPVRDLRLGTSFAPVVKKAAPSVVTICSTTTVQDRAMPFLTDPLWRHFFGDLDSGAPAQPRAHREQGLGSGVIVSANGYILTANHVVEGADSVKVALASSEKQYDAKVIGTDPPTDVAVLKIEANRPLPAITLADSDKLEVGDVVLAVGNPFNVGQTVTLGIISALGRGGLGISGYEDFIQTDAAINPGNSGGALVDAQGRLVGINTAIFSHSGGYQGVGFAVPINLARFAMDNLIRQGKVVRGYLGVINPQTLSPGLAKSLGFPEDTTGVLVADVASDSPAQRAGLQSGDVIAEISGRKLNDERSLRLMVAQTPPGSHVDLRVLRATTGQKATQCLLAARLAEMPSDLQASASPSSPRSTTRPRSQSNFDCLDGVEVADLDPHTRHQLELPANLGGALVVNVDGDCNAADAGLRPGDVILEIDRHPVANADAAVELCDKARGELLLLRLWSRPPKGGSGSAHFLSVDNLKHK